MPILIWNFVAHGFLVVDATSGSLPVPHNTNTNIDMTHIQYQGETLPFPPFPFPLVLAFHLVLGKFHIYELKFFPQESFFSYAFTR